MSKEKSQGRLIKWAWPYGFIDPIPSGDYLFLHHRDIIPSVLGHQCAREGDLVLFEWTTPEPGFNRPRARNLEIIRHQSDSDVDLETYSEFSEFSKWLSNRRNFGFLHRSCGEDIGFHISEILTEGMELLAPGVFVRHKVRKNPRNGLYEACAIEIFEPGFIPDAPVPEFVDEIAQTFMEAPELELEPESICSFKNRRKTILELIEERRSR